MSTRIILPPEPLHCEEVAVETHELPDGVDNELLVKAGRSRLDDDIVGSVDAPDVAVILIMDEDATLEVDEFVAVDVPMTLLFKLCVELVDPLFVSVSAGESGGGCMVAPCIQSGTDRPSEL